VNRLLRITKSLVGLALLAGCEQVALAEESTPRQQVGGAEGTYSGDQAAGADPRSTQGESLAYEVSTAEPGEAAASATPKPKSKPYKDVFYQNDFSYLDAPDYVSSDPFDALKRICVAPCTVLDVGGEYRLRYLHEDNLRLNGLTDDYLLQRTRLYGDLWYNGWLRGYAEFIDATSSFEHLTPRLIDENRADFLNLFGEAKLCDDFCGGSARVGRQELIYGAQRLISPLDWSDTRRTFDGAKLFWRSSSWDLDGFWTRPVPFSQHINNDHNFDHPDQSQQFYGLYATWHAVKDHTWDFYYLGFEDNDPTKPYGNELAVADFHVNTIGTRYQGRCCDWLWEVEGGHQFGEVGDKDISAGFYTIGGGYEFQCLPWKPVFWTYFDWASGDSNPTDGHVGTFNQLFPFGHKYMGFVDLVARQNIEDWNFQLTAKPTDRVTLLAWWHIFHLEEARDALYNAAGAVIRKSPTGAAGTDVGQELDLTAQVQLTPHADVLFGYSHFFAGEFIAATGNPDDSDFFYLTLTFKF